MLSHRSRLALAPILATILAGCGTEAGGDDPGDAPSTAEAVTVRPCAASDTSLFFHGMSGYGRELARTGLCVPELTGNTGFWSEVAFIKAPASTVAGGYSAGRIPLIRRLAKGEGLEQTAVLLDPSYADGPRFEGRTGPDIVDAWLAEDAARRFVLVYLPSSAGWREYAALASRAHGDQVKTCAVTGSHLELPALVTAQLFVDPTTWVSERCAP
ncbi:MAG: hypothetical protein JWP87_5143 [Labilithrix sp.]|nr:hypothetical protein [Labilithrix sp.]